MKTNSLVDCGTVRFTFINIDFVTTYNLTMNKLKGLRRVEKIDGREKNTGSIEYLVRLSCTINDHWEELPGIETKLEY